MTALMYAAANGHQSILEALLYKCAAINVADGNGQTALTHVATKGNENTFKALILGGCGINIRNKDGRTPIYLAASSGFEVVVKIIVSKSCEIDAKDTKGRTTLWWSASPGNNTAIVQTLLKNGASPDAKSESGERLGDIAHLTGNEDAYELLRLDAKNGSSGLRSIKTHRFFKT
ncbi:hypothetical protein N7450_001749 [Penicillium hetheringtonii]|uniref:Uncharacterized protein n=1 Tax=Penicillium hetheringtonii TaxID=911720 RepID=A0AAD6E552_9EURO|nr:hypothetical protein N7450_001749 [Penicillium hetheringtonii]